MPEVLPRGRHRVVVGRHRNSTHPSGVRRPAVGVLVLALAATLLAFTPLNPNRSGAAAIIAPTVGATIKPGTILSSGAVVTTLYGQFALTMQGDGDLVLTGQGQQLWHTGTAANPGAWAALQSDGNFVVYSKAGRALWTAKTVGHPDDKAVITTDGNLAIVGASSTYWQTGTVDSTLASNRILRANQMITSTGRNYVLIMQGDGNLVMYGQAAAWHTHTNGNPGAWAVMQGDGNLVVYSAAGKALWQSHTYGKGLATVTVTDSSNLVIMSPSNTVFWQSQPAVTAPAAGGGSPINLTSTSALTAGH